MEVEEIIGTIACPTLIFLSVRRIVAPFVKALWWEPRLTRTVSHSHLSGASVYQEVLDRFFSLVAQTLKPVTLLLSTLQWQSSGTLWWEQTLLGRKPLAKGLAHYWICMYYLSN